MRTAGGIGRLWTLVALVAGIGISPAAHAQSFDDLRQMSIEDLASVSVTSVSKTDEPLSEAPAAIYVITRDDIRRSTAATIPEMLRLAPNLQVYQQAPGKWVVTARGMNGNPGAQSFSNKLLVLVDGRSVYTPLFSGVYWDLPDVMPGDVDRIEVISGPGATLWGANAVNGVVNIITRSADLTQGVAADLRAGSSRQALGLRVGGSLGDTLTWRAGLRFLHEKSGETATGALVGDPYRRLGGTLRLDWALSQRDSVTLNAEVFDGRLGPGDAAHEDTAGRNVTLRWQRQSPSGALQVQASYDRIQRASVPGGRFFTDTWDLDVQRSLTLGTAHRLVFGGGLRVTHYRIDGTPSLFFDPAQRTLKLANGFVRDTIALTDTLTLTGGLKVEKDPYVAASLLPEARIAWKPSPSALLWAGVSRAVRSPTPFDRDVEERAGFVSLSGDRTFRTEKLTAYEAGVRLQPARSLSLSLTGFYHQYDDLRTVELRPGPGFNLSWGNGLAGHSYGLDAWAEWKPASWWRLSGGMSLLAQRFTFKPGASGIIGPSQLGSDPPHQFQLRSSMTLPAGLQLDLGLRAVGALPSPHVDAYREANARLAWSIMPQATLAVTGTNLLHARHLEYPTGDYLPRRVMAGLDLAF